MPGLQEADLPVLVLDTILCGLADHPENIRAFEQCGGVAEVVRLLKSKQVGKSTRCARWTLNSLRHWPWLRRIQQDEVSGDALFLSLA